MQIRISVVDPARGGPERRSRQAAPADVPVDVLVDVLADVLVDVSPGRRFDEVAGHLIAALGLDTDDHPGAPAKRFLVEGRPVPGENEFGSTPLVEGVLLTIDRRTDDLAPRTSPPPGGGLVELHVIGGPRAGQVVHVGRGTHVIGRGPACAIQVEDPGASRTHAQLLVSDGGVHLRDLTPTNATTVDGRLVPDSGLALEPGARIRVGSTTLVRRRQPVTQAPTTQGPGILRIHRRPRFIPAARPPTITFPVKPQRPEGHRLPLIASLAPVLLAFVLARVMSSPAMLLFALMTPVMLIGQWLSDRRHGRVSHRRQLAAHARQTEEAHATLADALTAEAHRRHTEHPDLAQVLDVACHRDVGIWQRRPGDPDHLTFRLGTATQPAQLTVSGTDALEGPEVADVPAVLALGEVGVAGICGPRRRALSVAGGLVAQLATWQSPRDARLVILTGSADPASDWGWAARLPHARPIAADTAVAAVANLEDGAAIGCRIAELEEIVRSRSESPSPLSEGAARLARPDIVVILDGSHDLRLVPGVASLLGRGPAVGVRFLGIDTVTERLPVETIQHLEIDSAPAPVAVLTTATLAIGPVLPDLPTMGWLERIGRALAPLEDATPDEHESLLPSRIGFTELHRNGLSDGIDPTNSRDLASAWSSSPGIPRALLGMSRQGPYAVSLDRDGPHTLVGGTTGSGKSELLQTLVAGLAVTNRPDQLGFVLVDYKGGSAFKDCARLPHTLGVVTDLDEHLTERALTSLGAELKRRERVLSAVGAKDLADYRERARPGSPALPRLVLVVDEFKMLADELPDFVAGLVRIAAVGRSLGVHLVLATQRPGGIVSGDMRANVSLRIALRVRDRADSEDVIEAPDAATVSDRLPGRGWVRTAGQHLLELQTAYVGSPAHGAGSGDADPTAPEIPAVWRLGWADLARPAPRRAQSEPLAAARTELAAIVDAAQAAAGILELDRLPSPWLPPLPELLSAHDLYGDLTSPARRAEDATEAVRVDLGLIDLPHEQRQAVWTWGLDAGHLGITGGSRTGRSTALRTIALGLADRYSPERVHIHVLEGVPGSLHDLEQLPHVGSVTGTANPHRARRAISRFVDQLTVPSAPSPADARGPATVVLIDGWESLKECLDEVEHGRPLDDLMRILRDGLAGRVHVAVTGGRAVLVGQLPSLVQHRLVLALPDPLDLTLAGVPTDAVPTRQGPGRAVDVRTGAEVQLAVHAGDPRANAGERGGTGSRADQVAATASIARTASTRWEAEGSGRAWRLAELPAHIELTAVTGPGLPQLMIGVGGDDVSPVGFDLDRDHRRILVTGPARSGRSTTLLALAHRLLPGGRNLAVVTTRRSPLTQLRGIRTVHLFGVGDRDPFVDLRREHPDLAILVDDAEGIDGTPIGQALLEATRLVDPAGGLIAVSADLRRAAEHYRGLMPAVAAPGTGILLSPGSVADGEIFRVRVEPQAARHPGRGLLLLDGEPVPIQVGWCSGWA